jgi:hypothetical protein
MMSSTSRDYAANRHSRTPHACCIPSSHLFASTIDELNSKKEVTQQQEVVVVASCAWGARGAFPAVTCLLVTRRIDERYLSL